MVLLQAMSNLALGEPATPDLASQQAPTAELLLVSVAEQHQWYAKVSLDIAEIGRDEAGPLMPCCWPMKAAAHSMLHQKLAGGAGVQ